MAPPLLTTIALAYLLGSLPFGFLLVRLFRGEDIRLAGSGNIGATNVSRTSPTLGIFTLLLDAVKGFAAVALTRYLFPNISLLPAVAALFAVAGHVFPVWLKFRGGKGVATGLGSFLPLAPKTVLIVVVIFIFMTIAFRYISFSSIIAVIVFPLLALLIEPNADLRVVYLMAATSLLIVSRHHGNIRRLLAGSEPRFGWKHS